jgi:hypothetical protein
MVERLRRITSIEEESFFMTQTLPSTFFVMLFLLQPPPDSQPSGDAPSATKAEDQASSTKDTDLTHNMDRMATSVTRMSEMCEKMMRHEEQAMPYKIAAGVSLGAVVAVALILLVVLEVQWIIYFSRLLKTQNRTP